MNDNDDDLILKNDDDLIFTNAHARALAARILPAAKPGTTKIVMAGVDKEGVQLAASFEFEALKADWMFKTVVRHDWSGNNLAAGGVIIQWK